MNQDLKYAVKEKNMIAVAEHRDDLYSHPRLKFLFVELTNGCNLHCLHCGSNCSGQNTIYIDTELLLNALYTVAEDFDRSSVMICLTGGEPLLHPDFFLIAEEIVKLGFPWGMTTNGTLIDDSTARRLKALSLQSITISLDGTNESHDKLRGRKGAFQSTVHAIHMLNQVGIPVQITSVIHNKNITQLEEMYSLMIKLNVFSWRIINIEPIGRATEHNALLLSHENMIRLLSFIRSKRFDPSCKMDVRYGCSHYLSFEYENEVRDGYFLCGSGILVGSILCNGDIFSCLDIERRPELIQGNIALDRFSDVWYNKFKEFRINRTLLSDKCSQCEERSFCHGDSCHTWNFDINEPMFCIKRKDDYFA